MNDTKEKAENRRAQKFLFDLNCFDDGYVEEVIPEEPPPPTFSEEELAEAERAAHERGRREALAEAAASREKHVADLLGTISRSFSSLFGAEAERAARYETEAVIVARAVFSRLFPALNARHGLEEVASMIAGAMENRRGGGEIVLEIHPDYRGDIEKRLESVRQAQRSTDIITLRGDDTLGPGDCRMRWEDGGAARDVGALAEEIGVILEQLLAGKPSLQDNNRADAAEEPAIAPPAPDPDPVPDPDGESP